MIVYYRKTASSFARNSINILETYEKPQKHSQHTCR